MSNNKVEICPHCGQKMVTYRHKLNKVLISALLKLQQAGGKGKVDNLGLTHSEFANMQKLRYFGLVDKDRNNYILNELGEHFLNGTARVPSVVYTKHGVVVGADNFASAGEIDCFVQAKEEWQKQATLGNIA